MMTRKYESDKKLPEGQVVIEASAPETFWKFPECFFITFTDGDISNQTKREFPE